MSEKEKDNKGFIPEEEIVSSKKEELNDVIQDKVKLDKANRPKDETFMNDEAKINNIKQKTSTRRQG